MSDGVEFDGDLIAGYTLLEAWLERSNGCTYDVQRVDSIGSDGLKLGWNVVLRDVKGRPQRAKSGPTLMAVCQHLGLTEEEKD